MLTSTSYYHVTCRIDFVQGLLCDAWVVPLSELGQDDKQLHCRTHLGHILKDGDTAYGFNFGSANLNDSNLDLMKPADIPDIVSCSWII